ncbi:single-stranded-DNA-specific exonuclease RecJ [Romboutsia sp. 1001216sp1]|uniref:single-stranded-DNA-specific exonuclease RecJ n=1 Tax=unclassified Romboutsia TaxID=2626894 RepID=UPI0018A8BFE5|nr:MULTISPECIES: single-stranded-DNA-specific exonuclease RecJ [unclassified Romboutsia]MDB8793775.1 single-stranded-DNA-specific exonuclease RecJ [Romboutsia sp. 1001216sp1]MDB8797555.1 single-stranded-DNA-specific exonuclease RecJ [Romboutsia sp. 1001216sp1]MDB8799971.1 single-stranded-DNA-specific exonuclease RecJ [Romboutsia sp. 1001216sp1]
MFNKKWTLKHTGDVCESELSKKLKISPEISQILKNREINNEKDAEIFMNPSLEYLRDPFLMKDMDKAVDRIKKAIDNKESIWIYGDYDVDGVSSTSILCLYFDSINYPVNYYIPNRLEEGYGINEEAIRHIHNQGCNLMISVDCGITSVEEVKIANELGIDVIITDHHECQSEIPNALAVINPKQEDCNYPFDMLCGCGVAFKLIQALTPKEEFKNSLYKYLEITTLATICDIVPLVDENRIIVKNGLTLMSKGNNIGLRELIKVCGVETEKIGSSHIGFSIGPRINASGRLGYSMLGVELFTTKDTEKAKEIAMLLEEKNNERQLIEGKMYQEAEAIIEANEKYKTDKVLVIANEGWQHGVIGIVASKLTEKYYKPTILLTIENGEATGSARSIKGFSIFDALVRCKDLLNKFGGHEQAAGLSLDKENIDKLSNEVNKFAEYELTEEDLIENVKAELELKEESISLELVEELHKLEPYGLNNPNPRFIVRDAILKSIITMGKNKQHIKFTIEKEKSYECIGFNMAYLKERYMPGDKVDVLFQLDENNFMGRRSIQLLLKDIRMSYPKNSSTNEDIIELFSKTIPNENCLYDIKEVDKNSLYEKFGFDNIEEMISGNKDINIFDYITKDTLVIANTINGFYKAISDISLVDEDIIDGFDINYNEIMSNSDKLQLIFSPNIEKINIKRYNNIILYDYLYNMGDYSHLYEKANNEAIIIKYYSQTDLLYLNNIVNNLIPEREEFIYVYKFMLSNKEINVDFKDIKKVFNMIPLKVFTILKVFKELLLLDFEFVYDNLLNTKSIHIKLLPKPDKKLNLDESKILKNLKTLNEKYRESY